jgi:hypothetical protein
MACRGARLGKRALSADEVHSLLASVDRADFGCPCVHSTIVVSEVPFLELARRAGAGEV